MPTKSKPGDIEREKYWNEDYVNYWRARVNEANNGQTSSSHMVLGDTNTTTDNLYINTIGMLKIRASDKVLELACGFGRSLPMLCREAAQVAAVDISEQMINAARQACPERNISFHVSPSEQLPFSEESFDVVVCFAAFDAMYQTEALAEMNRVSKKGARVLITGKNDNYYDDDEAALAAEIGARGKGHPNYFTDVEKLVRNVEKFGFGIETQKYYRRRGDFGNALACGEMPELFYEYMFVLKKIADCELIKDLSISDKISKTFARRQSSA